MIQQVEKAAFLVYPPVLVEYGSLHVGEHIGKEFPKDFGRLAAVTERKEE